MTIDVWLPIGYKLPDGAQLRHALFGGPTWQIFESLGGGRALLVHDELAKRWVNSGLVHQGSLLPFEFGDQHIWSISCSPSQVICPVAEAHSPDNKTEALAFALAFKATREIDKDSPIQDAIYVEKISRVLPTYGISSKTDEDIVLGYWLTGGASISVNSFRRLRQTLSWLGATHLKEVIEAAGFDVTEVVPTQQRRTQTPLNETQSAIADSETGGTPEKLAKKLTFELAGRPELETFFNEHIVEIVQNKDRYKALGIDFPSAVVLHGPPGCGKTFAVERLVDFLGWPSFQIDASSVASPFIHETSKKVSEIFEKAMQNAPSVLVIDEMEAFLADRELGSGHHRVEEVAEFLRRIPEATKNDVLIIAMTNRIEMIDPAILRRGRFDHVIKVDLANESEVLSLLEKLLSSLPREKSVDPGPLAKELAGRPISDVAFVVREGARLAARAGKYSLDQNSLITALYSSSAQDREGDTQRQIGFV